MTLKITKVTTTLLKIPLKQRTITDSQSTVDAVEFLQVRLDTDGGVTGYGMNWSYTPGLREDLARVAALRKALGAKIDIMTDVNCAWNLATARYWGAKLADYDVYWLEEPMPPEDVKSHAELARAIAVPIAVGETLYTKFSF